MDVTLHREDGNGLKKNNPQVTNYSQVPKYIKNIFEFLYKTDIQQWSSYVTRWLIESFLLIR